MMPLLLLVVALASPQVIVHSEPLRSKHPHCTGRVEVPQLEGLADATVEKRVNDLLGETFRSKFAVAACGAGDRQWIEVSARAGLCDFGILSIAYVAGTTFQDDRGMDASPHASVESHAINIDLRSGAPIGYGEMFRKDRASGKRLEAVVARALKHRCGAPTFGEGERLHVDDPLVTVGTVEFLGVDVSSFGPIDTPIAFGDLKESIRVDGPLAPLVANPAPPLAIDGLYVSKNGASLQLLVAPDGAFHGALRDTGGFVKTFEGARGGATAFLAEGGVAVETSNAALVIVSGLDEHLRGADAPGTFTFERATEKPLPRCRVKTAKASFFSDACYEPLPAYVVKDDSVETVPVRQSEFVRARFTGQKSSVVGLLKRADLDCPPLQERSPR